MGVSDRFRRLDDRVLGPPPPGRRRDPFSPRSLAWGAVGFAGSLITRSTWGVVLFLSVGVVGMFAGGLIRSRRAFASVVVPDQAPVTADRSDPVRAWLTRRNQRVRSLLVFAARFPFIAGPAIGAVVGYGISNQRSCVTYRNSDRCSFYVPGHHTVTGGAGWGLLAAVLIYVGALEVRRALIRASDAQAAQEMHTDSVKPDAPILDQPQGSYDDDLILVRTHDRTGGRIGKDSRRDQHAE